MTPKMTRQEVQPRVLVVTQRMHPNLRELHHMITSRGGACLFVVSRIGPSEPEVFSDRIKLGEPARQSDIHGILDWFKPNLLIQRDFRNGRREFWKIARQSSIRSFVYDQNPVMVPVSELFRQPWKVIRLLKDFLVRFVLLGRHERLSPVAFWRRENTFSFPNSCHVPFPMRLKAKVKVGSDSRLPKVVCVAKHGQRRKRVAWLIGALKSAPFDFELTIIGSSPGNRSDRQHFQELEESISGLGPRKALVTLMSDLSEREINQVFQSATAFILPARREQMAISPLEAMAHGLPVLVSSDGGSISYISPISKQQVFRSYSQANFRKKLFTILGNSKLREDLGRRNFDSVAEAHSPENLWRGIGRLLGEEPLPKRTTQRIFHDYKTSSRRI